MANSGRGTHRNGELSFHQGPIPVISACPRRKELLAETHGHMSTSTLHDTRKRKLTLTGCSAVYPLAHPVAQRCPLRAWPSSVTPVSHLTSPLQHVAAAVGIWEHLAVLRADSITGPPRLYAWALIVRPNGWIVDGRSPPFCLLQPHAVSLSPLLLPPPGRVITKQPPSSIPNGRDVRPASRRRTAMFASSYWVFFSSLTSASPPFPSSRSPKKETGKPVPAYRYPGSGAARRHVPDYHPWI